MGKGLRRLALIWAAAGCLGGVQADVRGPYAPIFSQWATPSREEVGSYKTLKFIDGAQRSAPLGQYEKVFASTCRNNLVLSDFLDEAELKRVTPPEPVDLSAPVTQPLDAFRAIRATVLGRAILKKFMPKYGTEIKVEMTDPRAIKEDSRSSALAFYDPLRKLIRIEKDAEIGMVAFVLLHEIVHSLDRDYGNAVAKHMKLYETFYAEVDRVSGLAATRFRKRPDQLAQSDFQPEELARLARLKLAMEQIQDIQIFRAERFAYDASYDVWKQLSDLFPGYYKKKPSRAVAGEGFDLKGPPVFYSDDDVVRINNLNPTYIRKFREGKCTPWNGSLASLPK